MKKKLAAAALVLALTAAAVPAAAFDDVDDGLYYSLPIAWAVEQGITTGTSETTFSPDSLCTQGQILTFLWRAAGSPEPASQTSSIAGVSQRLHSKFYKAILWASETGILEQTRLSPDAPCGRGLAMLYLWRFAGAPEPETSAAFTDVAPEDVFAPAVAWAVEQGITEGTTEATFSPEETCTRGQIAAFLYRALNEPASGDVTIEPPEETEEPQEPETPPLRVLTCRGTAYSMGLDGSEFTNETPYEAEATVEIYSDREAAFTIQVPFPLYQAWSYSIRFEKSEDEVYAFTYNRWDEAFADMVKWEGPQQAYHFVEMTSRPQTFQLEASQAEDDRTGGQVFWRVTLPEESSFRFHQAEAYTLSCEVHSG